LETFATIDKSLFAKEDQEDLVVALNVESRKLKNLLWILEKRRVLIVLGHHNYANDS
jgi:hypothetical protein